jgi:nucleoside 2-deoxyribosyltransferase
MDFRHKSQIRDGNAGQPDQPRARANGRGSQGWTRSGFTCLTGERKRCQELMKAYLAGPDVFLPNASQNATAKIAICARYGIVGQAPFDVAEKLANLPDAQAWRVIYLDNIKIMQGCDIIIANLTPFRGSSADAGTLVELGWFLGQNKPVFGYSNSAELFDARSHAYRAAIADPIPGVAIEGFGLPDNLMIAGAAQYAGGLPIILPQDQQTRAFDALDIFEACVAAAAKVLGIS